MINDSMYLKEILKQLKRTNELLNEMLDDDNPKKWITKKYTISELKCICGIWDDLAGGIEKKE